jgi:hypothetical protein
MRIRVFLLLAVFVAGSERVHAAGRVLDGAPVSLNKAQTWCVAQLAPLPSWDGPGHPECKMVWRVLGQKDDRILYSARYAWPSPTHSAEPLRVLTEVLFEGVRGSRIVRKLYAVQDDEAHVRLEPLRLVTVGGASLIESRVCMTATGECGRELAVWSDGRVDAIDNHTVADLRGKLPAGYDIKLNPELHLAAMSGSGKAWAKGDADCCPSAAIEFTLRLTALELHVEDVKLQRRGA